MKQKYWMTSQMEKFEIIAEFNPNEENDTWVEYRNVKTKETYTARKEAFLARFTLYNNQ